jgi:hypothetical protein
MVHYCGQCILPVHWTVCKAVLAVHAGSATSKLATTTKALKEEACLRLYLASIEALDEFHFDKASRDFFSHSFQSAFCLPLLHGQQVQDPKRSPWILPKGFGVDEKRMWLPLSLQ